MSLSFVLIVRFSVVVRMHIIPIHALFCCVLVALYGVMVSCQGFAGNQCNHSLLFFF